MEETGRTDSFERFPYLEMLAGCDTADGDEAMRESEAVREPEATGEHAAAGIREERYHALLRKLSVRTETPVLTTAVNLALAATMVSEFAAYLNYYTGNRATIQLACEMCGELCPDYAKVQEYRKVLSRAFCVEKKEPSGYANIEADQELLAYLTGAEAPNAGMDEKTEWFCHRDALHPMYVREQLADSGAKRLLQGDRILHICGSGGRRFLVKHIAKRMKRDVLFVRASQVCGEEEDKERRLMQTLRRAFLYSCIVCIRGESRGEEKQEGTEKAEDLFYVTRVLSDAGIPVVLCTNETAEIPAGFFTEAAAEEPAGCRSAEGAAKEGVPKTEKTARIELTPLSREERAQVWRGFAEQFAFEADIERCSVRYKLSASQIARAAAEWKNSDKNAADGKCDMDAGCEKGDMDSGREDIDTLGGRTAHLSDICYRIVSAEEEQKLGCVIKPEVRLSDLIVSEQMKRTLGEICCAAAQGYRIYEEWGLGRQYPYGKNVSVLLAGAPGTGKTMTAHVLAHEIGMPLYQVDLPHIMDKYIGETEKHLEQVFDFAAKTDMILFFDEADALFAKRGEVTEGKDRYANMEVSYLLQRMEQFDGIVILATNFYHHIDKAFLRRIKYVLKYQEPDGEMRKRIWESCLTASLPREAIDTAYLAKQFALSGGVIKNVIQNACICALYEKQPLRMEHVLRSVRMEYEKLERNMTPGFWGEYGYLMEQT